MSSRPLPELPPAYCTHGIEMSDPCPFCGGPITPEWHHPCIVARLRPGCDAIVSVPVGRTCVLCGQVAPGAPQR
jgi:hypothetical protein